MYLLFYQRRTKHLYQGEVRNWYIEKEFRDAPLVLKVNNDLVNIEIVVQPLTDRGSILHFIK